MNYFRATLSGVILWILVFLLFTLMNFIPVIKDSLMIQSMILYVLLIGFTYTALRFYNKKDADSRNGFALGVWMAFTGLILDSCITLPLVILPKGGSYKGFYSDPYLWVTVVEIILISALYYKFSVKNNEQE